MLVGPFVGINVAGQSVSPVRKGANSPALALKAMPEQLLQDFKLAVSKRVNVERSRSNNVVCAQCVTGRQC